MRNPQAAERNMLERKYQAPKSLQTAKLNFADFTLDAGTQAWVA
jgi:hypothetical protein